MSTQGINYAYMNGARAYSTPQLQNNTYEEQLLFAQQAQQNQMSFNGQADGDDGKLGFFDTVGSMIKGAGKSIVNFVTNPVNLLIGAGCVAASILCPPVGIALAIGGAIGGIAKVGEGLAVASQATTDDQARAAFENVGAGALQTGLSVVGAKASFSAAKSANISTGYSTMGKILHPVKSAKNVVNSTGSYLKAQGEKGSFLSKTVYDAGKTFKNTEGGIIAKSTATAKSVKDNVATTEFGTLYKAEPVSAGLKEGTLIAKVDKAGGAVWKMGKAKFNTLKSNYEPSFNGVKTAAKDGYNFYKGQAEAGGYTAKTGVTPAFGYLTPQANSNEDLMRLYYGY